MNEEVRSYSNDSQKKSAVTALILEFGIVLIVIAIVLILLNYFNVISLSRFGGIFSLLPAQEKEVEVPTEELLNVGIESPDALPFAPCPLESVDLCNQGEIVDEGDIFYGISYSDLPEGTQVFAVMEGTVEIEEQDGRSIVTIADVYGGQKAVLSILGEVSASSGANIEPGQLVGVISGNIVGEEALIVSFQSQVNDEFLKPRIAEDGSYVHSRL